MLGNRVLITDQQLSLVSMRANVIILWSDEHSFNLIHALQKDWATNYRPSIRQCSKGDTGRLCRCKLRSSQCMHPLVGRPRLNSGHALNNANRVLTHCNPQHGRCVQIVPLILFYVMRRSEPPRAVKSVASSTWTKETSEHTTTGLACLSSVRCRSSRVSDPPR
jgi:hypothetical protein